MGNNSSRQILLKTNDQQTFEELIDFRGCLYHRYFGQIGLWKQKKRRGCHPDILSKVVYEKEHNELPSKQRLDMAHENLFQYYGYIHSENPLLYGQIPEYTLYFEFFNSTLEKLFEGGEDLVGNRKNCYFFKILRQILSVCAFLQQNKLYHSDIRPRHIFFDSQQIVKIIEIGAVPEMRTGYGKALINSDNPYLAPILLEQLKDGQLKPKHNQPKSDMFSLGMTLLELSTLISSETYYDFEKYTIDYLKVEKSFAEVQKLGYSRSLVNMIKQMLTINENQRPSFIDLERQQIPELLLKEPVIKEAQSGRIVISPLRNEPRLKMANKLMAILSNQNQSPKRVHFERILSLPKVVIPLHDNNKMIGMSPNQVIKFCDNKDFQIQFPRKSNIQDQTTKKISNQPDLQNEIPTIKSKRHSESQNLRESTNVNMFSPEFLFPVTRKRDTEYGPGRYTITKNELENIRIFSERVENALRQ